MAMSMGEVLDAYGGDAVRNAVDSLLHHQDGDRNEWAFREADPYEYYSEMAQTISPEIREGLARQLNANLQENAATGINSESLNLAAKDSFKDVQEAFVDDRRWAVVWLDSVLTAKLDLRDKIDYAEFDEYLANEFAECDELLVAKFAVDRDSVYRHQDISSVMEYAPVEVRFRLDGSLGKFPPQLSILDAESTLCAAAADGIESVPEYGSAIVTLENHSMSRILSENGYDWCDYLVNKVAHRMDPFLDSVAANIDEVRRIGEVKPEVYLDTVMRYGDLREMLDKGDSLQIRSDTHVSLQGTEHCDSIQPWNNAIKPRKPMLIPSTIVSRIEPAAFVSAGPYMCSWQFESPGLRVLRGDNIPKIDSAKLGKTCEMCREYLNGMRDKESLVQGLEALRSAADTPSKPTIGQSLVAAWNRVQEAVVGGRSSR